MLETNRELRARRGALMEEARKLMAPDKPSREDMQRVDRLLLDADRLRVQIDQLERRTGAPPRAGFDDDRAVDSPEVRSAFRSYLRRGRAELTPDERSVLKWDSSEFRDMGTGGGNALQGTGGGYFVPIGFQSEVEQALKYYGPMLDGGIGMPRILDTATGQPLPWPTSNDSGITGELIGENQQVSDADVTLGNIVFGAFKISSKMVKVSLELLQDSAFDLEAYLKEQFAIRVGRTVNTYATVGTGSSQPQGIVTAAVAGGLSVAAAGASTNDGGAETGGTSIGSDDLTNLEHKIDPLYRPGARYMFHDTTLSLLKRVKDKYGRPLWTQSTRDSEPNTINGYQYVINNDMDQVPTQAGSPPATKNTVLFGALPKFVIRRVKALSVLRLAERFAEYGQVAFIGFYRFDSRLLDAGTHPIAYLTNTY